MDIPNCHDNILDEDPPLKIIEKEKEIKINDNNNLAYLLKIKKTNLGIEFSAYNLNEIKVILFSNLISLEKFYQFNSFFRQYLTIDELYAFLKNKI